MCEESGAELKPTVNSANGRFLSGLELHENLKKSSEKQVAARLDAIKYAKLSSGFH